MMLSSSDLKSMFDSDAVTGEYRSNSACVLNALSSGCICGGAMCTSL